MTMLKYPRTPHIEGSNVQRGDEDMGALLFCSLQNQYLVIEEKLDGTNVGISFVNGKLQLQSRGHVLVGGHRERHFSLFKRWAIQNERMLQTIIGQRYVMYGEWLYAKHTLYYDALPHYFVEFDIFDKKNNMFIDTERRKLILSGSDIVSAPVVGAGRYDCLSQVRMLLGQSKFRTSSWLKSFEVALAQSEWNSTAPHDLIMKETDASEVAEGLYIKCEANGQVESRCKFVRSDFTTTVRDSNSHWLSRPIIKNTLIEGVDLFENRFGEFSYE